MLYETWPMPWHGSNLGFPNFISLECEWKASLFELTRFSTHVEDSKQTNIQIDILNNY